MCYGEPAAKWSGAGGALDADLLRADMDRIR